MLLSKTEIHDVINSRLAYFDAFDFDDDSNFLELVKREAQKKLDDCFGIDGQIHTKGQWVLKNPKALNILKASIQTTGRAPINLLSARLDLVRLGEIKKYIKDREKTIKDIRSIHCQIEWACDECIE